MAIIKKAKVEDFEIIYPLLQGLDNSRLTKDNWRQLFVDHWNHQQDYFGYVMMDNDKAVGFLGLVFSERLINKKIEKFCSMSSWIVKEEYRSESIPLLFPVLGMKELTMTVFTPSPVTYSVLKRFGFQEITSNRKLIPAVSLGSFLNKDCSIVFDNEGIRHCLDERESKIYSDHLKFNCIHLAIKTQEGNCYIILKKCRERKLPFGEIHYISHLEIFLKYIAAAKIKICLPLRILGLIVEERYLRGSNPKPLATIKSCRRILYKSPSLEKSFIDTLYSELFVLDLL